MITGNCRHLLIALLLLAFTRFGLAAESLNASVTVISQQNGEPLVYATVKVVPLPESNVAKEFGGNTDFKGEFAYTFTGPCVLQISHMGYNTITDTLLKPEKKSYKQGPRVYDFQDVVVTGQYAPGSVQKSVYEVKVIGGAELTTKGANNLREALQNKLNIDLGQDPVFGSSMSINGISGEGIKIMVDGVPIIGRMDGKLDLSQINVENIDHIEIVEGPLSVVYGTDALGGVVNIITKTFQAEKVNLNLKGYYETVGQYNVALNTGFAFRKNQIYLSAGRDFFDGFSTDTLPRFQQWKPKEQYFADAKYVLASEKLRFSLTCSFFREALLDRGVPHLGVDDATHNWTYFADDRHYLVYRPRASASFMYRFKQSNQLDMLLAYTGWFRMANRYNKNMVTGNEMLVPGDEIQDTSKYHHIVGRATYTLPAWKYRLNFQFGLDLNHEFVSQTRLAGQNKQMGDYAVFGSAKINLVEGLDVQPAIRFAYNTIYKTPLIPSLNIRYNWKDRLVFRASYGRGLRSPSMNELYLDFNIDAHIIKGNSSLKSEDGHNAAASINYYFATGDHKLTFTGSGFFNYIFNKIELIQVDLQNPTLTFQYHNYKKYSTYGGQTGISYAWKRLQANISAQVTGYNIVYNTIANNNFKTWGPDFNINATYVIPKAKISIYVSYKLNGQKPLVSVDNMFRG